MEAVDTTVSTLKEAMSVLAERVTPWERTVNLVKVSMQ